MNPTFSFEAELWLYPKGNWVFLTVPADESEVIADLVESRRGFGSVRVEVTIGDTVWRTSIFPDSKSDCFVLPIKKAVRVAANVDAGCSATVELTVLEVD